MDDDPDCGYLHSMATTARTRCKEASALSWEFRKALNNLGVAEINWRVSKLIHLGPAKLNELSQSAKKAESEHVKARHAYADHIANCSACTEKIVALEFNAGPLHDQNETRPLISPALV